MKYLLLIMLIGGCFCLPSYAEEKYDAFYNADGSLRDPVPGDGYTAKENYGILALALWAVFVVWAGCLTRGNPIAIIIAAIIAIIGSMIVWQW